MPVVNKYPRQQRYLFRNYPLELRDVLEHPERPAGRNALLGNFLNHGSLAGWQGFTWGSHCCFTTLCGRTDQDGGAAGPRGGTARNGTGTAGKVPVVSVIYIYAEVPVPVTRFSRNHNVIERCGVDTRDFVAWYTYCT